MRFPLLFLLSLLLMIQSIGGELFRVFAPSSKTNALLVVNAEEVDGKLKLTLEQETDLGFPAKVITSHPTKPLLYLTPVNGDSGNTPGAVVTLNNDGSYQKFQPVSLNDGACYLSLDRTASFLFGVSYRSGRLNVYPLDDLGVPKKAVTTIDQNRKAAHCVLVSNDNSFLYIPYVKDNLALFQYRFDPSNGNVEPLSPINAKPPEGTGPRHMAYHPSLPMVYFSNEQGVGLSSYEKQADGQLKFRQDIKILPEGMASEGLSASDLVITTDGKYLFAGLRGHRQEFDKISRYQIKLNGEAEFIGFTDADKIPWGLAISPKGDYLLVSATNGATLTAYKIAEDGDLKRAASLQWESSISDLIAR